MPPRVAGISRMPGRIRPERVADFVGIRTLIHSRSKQSFGLSRRFLRRSVRLSATAFQYFARCSSKSIRAIQWSRRARWLVSIRLCNIFRAGVCDNASLPFSQWPSWRHFFAGLTVGCCHADHGAERYRRRRSGSAGRLVDFPLSLRGSGGAASRQTHNRRCASVKTSRAGQAEAKSRAAR